MNVIELSDVWLSYRPRGSRGQRQAAVWALREIDLTVGAGECVALVGSNGSGKSTLLRVAAGIFEPSRGRVLRARETGAVLDLTIGVNRDLSGYQALEVYAAVDGINGARWRQIRDEVAAATWLDPQVLERSLSTYSLGMLLRLQFALAITYQRDALVVDEVLAAADGTYRAWACERILEARDRGAAVLMASHDPDLAKALAKRVVILDKGQIRYDGPVVRGLQTYDRQQLADARSRAS